MGVLIAGYGVSCPALADYGISCPALVSSGYPAWYPLAGSGMSHGVLWLCSGILLVILWVCSGLPWLALVCLIDGYALMMSCVKIDHALTLHFGYCLFMLS